MRIIGGSLKGIRLHPPQNLPVRPTTDIAKEALFNILNNQITLENLEVLDLFSGTGNISLEFASRGAVSVKAVDKNFGCYQHLKKTAEQLQITTIEMLKADVFKFLKSETKKYDLIFADPPYDISQIPQIAEMVFEQNLLKENGLLIIEHQSNQDLSKHGNFAEKRKYGYSAFSFFRN